MDAIRRTIFVMLLLLYATSGYATQYFVDTAATDDSANCTSSGTPCKTVQGAAAKMIAHDTCGDSLFLKGNGQVHRTTGSVTFNKVCTAGSRITIGAFTFNTSTPKVRSSVLTTSGQWSVHSGSNCTGGSPSLCTWKRTTTLNPGRHVFQNMENPPVVQRNGDVVTSSAPTDQAFAMHNAWADSTTSGTCPSGLTKRYHFCWSGGQLFLVSLGNPATALTEPGVEVIEQQSSLFIINAGGYKFENLHLSQSAASLLKVDATARNVNDLWYSNIYGAYSAQKEANFGGDAWTGNAGGTVMFPFVVEQPFTIANLLVENVTADNPGRDAMHFSHNGSRSGTINKYYCKNLFNHPGCLYFFHNSNQPNGAGTSNFTINQLKNETSCGSLSGNPAVGSGTLTYNQTLILNQVDSTGSANNDPRMPIDAECQGAIGQVIATGNSSIVNTFNRGLIIGEDWQRGAYFQHSGVTNINDFTIHGMSRAGISGTATTGIAATLRRTAITAIPCCTSSQHLIGFNGSGNTTLQFAGDYAAFRNSAGTDLIGWLPNTTAGLTTLTTAQFKSHPQVTGHTHTFSMHATALNSIYVDVANNNFNPIASSPLIGAAEANTSPCVGTCEIGAFEIPNIQTGTANAATTWTFPIDARFLPALASSTSCAHPKVNGDSGRTGTLTMISSTVAQVASISGTTPIGSDTLTMVFDAGCIKDSTNLGNDTNFTAQSLAQTVSLTNNITGGGPPPGTTYTFDHWRLFSADCDIHSATKPCIKYRPAETIDGFVVTAGMKLQLAVSVLVGGADAVVQAYPLKCQKNAGSSVVIDNTFTSNDIKIATNNVMTHAQVCNGTVFSGEDFCFYIADPASSTPQVQVDNGQSYTQVYSVQIDTDITPGDTFTCKPSTDDQATVSGTGVTLTTSTIKTTIFR